MPRDRGPTTRAVALSAGLLLVAAHALGRPHDTPWDDAFFFKRVALNFVTRGAFAWNASEGPVYGSTSLGFQLLATALVALSPAHYFSWLRLVTAGLHLALLRLYLGASARPSPSADGAAAPPPPPAGDDGAAAGAALALLAWAAPPMLRLLPSGMDFHLGFVVLTCALLSARRHRPGWRGAISFGAWTTATYVVRPDAAALPLAALAAREVLGARRVPWRALVACAAGVGAVLALAGAYFGTVVPLSFYLKSNAFSNYGAEFVSMSLPGKRRSLATVLLFAAPLAYVALRRRTAATAAALLASSAFFAFHFASTVEVMGYQARFYLPGLVPLGLAAIEAAPEFRRRPAPRADAAFAALYAAATFALYRAGAVWTDAPAVDPLCRISPWLYAGYAAAVGLWLALARGPARRALGATAAALAAATIAAGPPPRFAFPSDEALAQRYIDRHTTTRGIRAVRACLPEPLRIYHSEIGLPGLLFANSDVTDFAGLMHEDVARHGFDVEGRCAAERPDVIFLPHKNYVDLRRRVEASACLRGYARMVAESSSPLYVRRDLAEPFRQCARRVGDPWVLPE